MRILVTGGAGFIGSHYVRCLLTGRFAGTQDAEVVVLDKLTYAGNLHNLDPVWQSPRLKFLHGDVVDVSDAKAALRGVDAVVHFAAESHVDRSILGAAPFVTTNVVGTQTMLDQARAAGVRRFVHVSTDEVYGSIAEGAWTETQPLEPTSPYAASKAASDLVALSYARTYGMHVMVTRCSNNYGPYQFPEKLIPLFLTNLMDGGTVPLYGDGLNVRDWLHVDDHCRALQLVLEGGGLGEIYNIGGGTQLSNLELTRLLVRAVGADESAIVRVADRRAHDRRYCVDIGKIARELGYAPAIPFAEGIAQTIAWYKDNREWWTPIKEQSALSLV